MRRFLLVLAVLTALVFALSSCGGSKKENVYDYPDEDSTDADADKVNDSEKPASDADNPEEPDEDSDNPQEPDEDSDNPQEPDEDSDNPQEPDEDSDDIDISDTEISDADSDNPQEPEDHDNPETPDETPDSDTPVNPEATENHKISGILQAGVTVSGVHAALFECGQSEEIASANTDENGKFSFNANISASYITYPIMRIRSSE